MATNYYDYSNIFNLYTDKDGFEYYNLYNKINIEGELDKSLYDTTHISSFTEWYDISYRYYGTVKLWWVALVANQITNPFEITPGQPIKILKKEVVSEILSQINNRNDNNG